MMPQVALDGLNMTSCLQVCHRIAVPQMSEGSYCYDYDAVLWAVESGITAGTSPAAVCTHAQIVIFLFRGWKSKHRYVIRSPLQQDGGSNEPPS